MKKIFLLIVAPVLLVTLGFGQNPASSSNTNQASLKGCIGGSDGNYTVAEDGTTQIFKITSSTVDLKAHVGHDVEVTGQKTNAAAGSASSDSTVAVTAVNMISEHCATAAAASTPAVADPTPTATASAPAVASPTPAVASTPAVADPIPAAAATTPAADPTPAAAATTPAADPTPAAAASTPAADPTPAAAASTPAADPTPAAAASTPAVADPTPAAAASAPVVANPTPTPAASIEPLPETASSLPLLGLLGLGLLATGLLSRRARTNQ
jgi:hypothetical protein